MLRHLTNPLHPARFHRDSLIQPARHGFIDERLFEFSALLRFLLEQVNFAVNLRGLGVEIVRDGFLFGDGRKHQQDIIQLSCC